MAGRRDKTQSKYYRPLGKHVALTPELQDEICKWIEDGNTFDDACAVVGIVTETARTWLRNGARELENIGRGGAPNHQQADCARFHEAVTKARAASKANAVRNVSSAGKEDWRASSWLLERQFPREYAPQIKVNVREELDGFLNALEAGLSPEEFARVLDVASRARDAQAPAAALVAATDQHEDD